MTADEPITKWFEQQGAELGVLANVLMDTRVLAGGQHIRCNMHVCSDDPRVFGDKEDTPLLVLSNRVMHVYYQAMAVFESTVFNGVQGILLRCSDVYYMALEVMKETLFTSFGQ